MRIVNGDNLDGENEDSLKGRLNSPQLQTEEFAAFPQKKLQKRIVYRVSSL
jgi:hypothetical protein